MVIDGNRLILIIGKKILFKKNSKSELSPKKIRSGPGFNDPPTNSSQKECLPGSDGRYNKNQTAPCSPRCFLQRD